MDLAFPKLTIEEADELQTSMELDLVAYFNSVNEDVYDILDKNISPEEMIKQIEEILK